MRSIVKTNSFSIGPFRAALMIILLSLVAAPLWAQTIVIKSDASNQGAAVGSTSDPRLTSGDISGLTFTPVGTDDLGTFTSPPTRVAFWNNCRTGSSGVRLLLRTERLRPCDVHPSVHIFLHLVERCGQRG